MGAFDAAALGRVPGTLGSRAWLIAALLLALAGCHTATERQVASPPPRRIATTMEVYEINEAGRVEPADPEARLAYRSVSLFDEAEDGQPAGALRMTFRFSEGRLASVSTETVGGSANDHSFARIAAGRYELGLEGSWENPPREVELEAFEIARHETTNEQFARFVRATGYVTEAEKAGWAWTLQRVGAAWSWLRTEGACWRAPQGPAAGGIEAAPRAPVVQISPADAEAYCRWAGLRLPTLDEWEAAARAGARGRFPWGAERMPEGKLAARVWTEAADEGSPFAARLGPQEVGGFAANAFGLYDVIGNALEICSDRALVRDEQGRAALDASARGGSWACGPERCIHDDLIEVVSMGPRVSTSAQGFRVAR